MKMRADTYTIRQLANLAGISVRTLHHYDQIGLLKPEQRSPAGYRIYRHVDLLRLQQILFYRELDVPLAEIQALLDRPDFDPVRALRDHREKLREKAARLERLIETIDKTLAQSTKGTEIMKDEELYKGFAPEQAKRYRREAAQAYGEETVKSSEDRIRGWGAEKWESVKGEMGAVTLAISELMDRDPGDAEVQTLVARHHAWIEKFYPAPAEVYGGLAQLYTDHPEFRAFYEKIRPGLAEYLRAAMEYYCAHALAVQAG
ncbi:predicted transcriptional regulator [Longilinea arvoryzae]|uniref:Predicted transcriptional regulator n=1 Tax=Longilinea arvoryzae TaxID=360412 RepID=A0A0S7B7I0_9CHLR|nr:MerR family transcriptional regulator [Longilinea arvoryzae]GAP13327.1 predicted transcriptional regulator [Longilinea arvoryzae]